MPNFQFLAKIQMKILNFHECQLIFLEESLFSMKKLQFRKNIKAERYIAIKNNLETNFNKNDSVR